MQRLSLNPFDILAPPARRTVLHAAVGVAAVAATFALVLGISPGSASTQAAGPGSPAAGIDMNVDGNTSSSLGTIDACREVANSAGTSFTLDTWLDAVPNGHDLAGFNYNLNFPDSAVKLNQQSHTFLFPGDTDLSEDVPDDQAPHTVGVAELGSNTTPAGSKGVLGRYTFEIRPGAADGAYALAFDKAPDHFTFADSSGQEWNNEISEILDGDHIPAYGVIAIGVPCGSPLITPSPTPFPTESPGATESPGPTDTAAVTPTPSTTPTRTAGPLTQGDLGCDGSIDALDALADLRFVAALSPLVQEEPCPDIGDQIGDAIFGDTGCNGSVDSVDALFIERYVAGLPVDVPSGCPSIGSPLTT